MLHLVLSLLVLGRLPLERDVGKRRADVVQDLGQLTHCMEEERNL